LTSETTNLGETGLLAILIICRYSGFSYIKNCVSLNSLD
jgi:hypothetical protein